MFRFENIFISTASRFFQLNSEVNKSVDYVCIFGWMKRETEILSTIYYRHKLIYFVSIFFLSGTKCMTIIVRPYSKIQRVKTEEITAKTFVSSPWTLTYIQTEQNWK